ncbi:hypothetical protein PInf_025486 [Phytophthora infestans]|nr:hypothetical protein PInf_025486 [Phytophthora infestans]
MESGWIALIVASGTETPLGLAVAKKYVKKGANVTLIGPAMEILEATQSELQKVAGENASVFVFECELVDMERVEQAVQEANATSHGSRRAALPAMIKAKTRGRIVFVSSVDSLEFPVGCGACSGSKSAIRGLADSSRNELLQYNMSVAFFYPGTSSYNLLDTSKGFETPIICNDATDESANEGNITTGYSTFTDQSLAATKSVDKQAQVVVIDGLWLGQYSITTTWNGFLLRMLSNGVEPRNNNFLECEGEIVKGTASCWLTSKNKGKSSIRNSVVNAQ